jgi:DNA-binding MarR family transcriptional regulator
MSRLSQNNTLAAAPVSIDLHAFTPYRLSVLANRVSKAIAARYERAFDLGIPEWRVVAVLGRTPGLSAREVAAVTAQDKVAVSRAVKRLHAMKRIRIEADASDARRQSLFLTPTGARLYRAIVPIALAMEEQILSVLSEKERAQFLATLRKVEAAIALVENSTGDT